MLTLSSIVTDELRCQKPGSQVTTKLALWRVFFSSVVGRKKNLNDREALDIGSDIWLILGLRPADEIWRYFVTTFLNGWLGASLEPALWIHNTLRPEENGWPDYSLKLWCILGELLRAFSLPLEIGCTPCFKTHGMNRPVCFEAHNYLLAVNFWQWNLAFFSHIKHKLCCKYSSQNISNAKNFNPHKKANPFVKYGHLFPKYAANLVASS